MHDLNFCLQDDGLQDLPHLCMEPKYIFPIFPKYSSIKYPENSISLSLNLNLWGFPDGPVVKDSVLPMQALWVRSLVGKLRSHMLHGGQIKIKVFKNLNL